MHISYLLLAVWQDKYWFSDMPFAISGKMNCTSTGSLMPNTPCQVTRKIWILL